MRVEVDVFATKAAEFPIAAAGEEGGPHHLTEIIWAGVDQASAFIRGQIPHHRRLDLLERLHGPPGVRIGDEPFMISQVQGRLEHS